jgi:hypothetical protein
MRRKQRVVLATGLAGALSLVLVAGSTSLSFAGQTTPHGISAAQLKYVHGVVAKYSNRPKSLGLHESTLGTVPKNKVIAYVYGNTPAAVITATSFKRAVAAMGHGWTYHGIELPNTSASAFQGGYSTALAIPHIAGIGSSSVDPSEIAPQIATAKAEGVKIAIVTGGQASTYANVAVLEGPKVLANWGALEADYILSRSNGKAHVLIATTTAIEALQSMANGFQAEWKLRCRSCAKPDFWNAPVTDLGTPQFATDFVAKVQSLPKDNYIYVGYNDLFIGVTQAMNNAGISGKTLITFNDDSYSDPLLGKTNGLAAEIGFCLLEGSWLSLDTIARMIEHKPITADLAFNGPGSKVNWFITLSQLKVNHLSTTADIPLVADYAKEFKALWK